MTKKVKHKKKKLLVCGDINCSSPHWDFVMIPGEGVKYVCKECGNSMNELSTRKIVFGTTPLFETLNQGRTYRIRGFSFELLEKLDIDVHIAHAELKDRIGYFLRTNNEYSKRNLIPIGDDIEDYDEAFKELTEKLNNGDIAPKPVAEHYLPWVRVSVDLSQEDMVTLFKAISTHIEGIDPAKITNEEKSLAIFYKIIVNKLRM